MALPRIAIKARIRPCIDIRKYENHLTLIWKKCYESRIVRKRDLFLDFVKDKNISFDVMNNL